MFETALCQAEPLPLPSDEGGGAPEWLHLLPAGEIHTVDTRGPYTLGMAPAELARRSLQASGGRMPLDENHSTDLAAPKGGPSPARGWIVALQARDDGIWGQVEWTEEGRRLVEGKAYRHISPVVIHGREKRITGILRASLVNRPNMRGLAALHQESSMDFFEKLRLQLGLADGADEAAALEAVKGMQTSMSTHAAELAGIAKAAGVADGAEVSVVLQHVQDLADPAKFVPVEDVIALQQELAAITSERAELQEDGRRAKAEAFVDAQIKAGKPGVKPLREHYVARHMAEPDKVVAELSALPSLTTRSGASETPPERGGETVALNAEDAGVLQALGLQMLGIDAEKFKATRAAIRAAEESAL